MMMFDDRIFGLIASSGVLPIAYNKQASETFGDFTGIDPLNLPRATRAAPSPVISEADPEALRRELRKIILEELSAVLAA